VNLIFHKIRFKNFLSCGDQFIEIPLDRAPLTLIVGKNGAGKSTVLDALCFCLFKKPFRKITLGLLVNSVTRKNCVVEVEFSIGDDKYLISRGIKPNKLEISKNGTVINHTNTDDYQTFLEKDILHINHKAFCQVVVLGSASYVPFLELPTPDRRKIIENILDLEVFSIMNVILKKRVQENDNLIRETVSQEVLINDRIHQMTEYQNKKENENKEKIFTYEKMLEGYRNLIKEKRSFLTDNILDSDIQDIKERKKKIENELQEEKTKSALYSSEFNKLSKEIEFYNKNCTCDVCKQNIDDNFKINMIKEKETALTNYSSLIEDCEMSCLSIKELLDNINKKYEEIINHKHAQEKLEFEIQSLITNGINTKKIMDGIKSEIINDQTKDLENLILEQTEINKKYDELIKKSEVMAVTLKLLKDDGIKANVILQYIDIINELINSYLLEMDFVCQFNLDSNFNEVIKSRYRDEFVYSSFSEGEKMRIDISLILTWREIARRRNSLNTNILFFDEVLDASLDSDGCKQFIEIIKKVLPDNNVFIISHNEKNKDNIENTIEFKKSSKGFSQVKL
jgi:DNA repair exonuclease SbcCD ATPase subunit